MACGVSVAASNLGSFLTCQVGLSFLACQVGKKNMTHRVAMRKGSDPGRKVLVHLRGPCPGQCVGIMESLPPSSYKAQGPVLW